PDRTPNQIAVNENITEYPTWEFPDGTRLTGVQTLETLSQRSGVPIPTSSTPSFDALSDVAVAIGSPLHIPIDAYDPNGNPLTVTVTSSDPGLLQADVLTGNRSLRLSTQGFGDMVFELFEGRAPLPSGRVITLAQSGFYDGVTFHRVINNFVIQGGDPTGTGAGGSDLGDFDDQFHLELQHNRTGVLSYAKSTDDTNDSQFFITEGPQRFLDFNHSVFGQLVEGEAVREAISNTATDASDRPINPVTINSATVFQDTENRVVILRPTGTGTGSATITVTVSDTEGNSTSQSFLATVVNDTANGAPFLNPIPPVQAVAGQTTTVQLTAQDKEDDTLIFSVQPLGTQQFDLSVDSSTGLVTLTPPAGFTGELQFRATVRQTTPTTTTSPDDNQVVTVNVIQGAPTGVDLDAASDTGTSDADDITSSSSLTFTVNGTVSGATVEIRVGETVVGSATASGGTTQVVVNDVTALGEGSVLFTATQTVAGVTSDPSPPLSVTLDRTGPAQVSSAVIPPTAVVGQPLSVNLEHSEESQGLIYGLTGAPTGMTIDPATGLLAWTPDASQVGTQTFALTLTDLAGNTTTQNFSIDVIDEPQVRIQLKAVDASGVPLTTVSPGETFRVQVTVEDLRPFLQASGVFGAYVDLLYDPNVIEPVATDPITHIAPYVNDKSGSTTTQGIVDELGAFSSSTSPLGNDLRVLAEVAFVAKAVGNAGLRLEGADETGNDILLFDVNEPIPLSKVQLGSLPLTVGANFQVADDTFNFDEDTGPHTLDVLSNDTVTGTTTLTIVAVGTPTAGGQVSVASDGLSVQYTPAANFNGTETFTYTVRNNLGVEGTATVTLQITDVNDPPIALNDTFTVFQNSSDNVLEVLTNDSTGVDSPGSESLRISSVSLGSQGGSIQIGPSGLTLRYTPAAGFEGTETFTYTLSDGRGGTATATVNVAVNLQNPPPTPQNDAFTVDEDADEATFDVLANDTTDDPDETLSVSAVGASTRGSTFRISDDGLGVVYKPAANFFGQEILQYTVRDSGGATANALVTFTVNPVNDPPDAVDDTFTVVTGNPTTTLDVLANDLNVDVGETLTIIDVTQPPTGQGTISIASDGRSLIYTSPQTGFEGTFTVTYTISDGNGSTDTASVNIEVRDFVPRSIRGVLRHAASVAVGPIADLELTLSGRDFSGNPVDQQVRVGPDGSFSFDNLPPGDYTLIRPPLPFLHDSGETIPITSGLNDGDAVTELQVTAILRPQFFDIRDFLGSTMANSLAVALDNTGTPAWRAARGAWANVSGLTVTVDSATDSLQISGVDADQNPVQSTVKISGGQTRAFEAGREGDNRLVKLVGAPSDVGLGAAVAATTSASTPSGEGEGTSTPATSIGSSSGLVAEGEGVPAIPTPTITHVTRTPSSAETGLSPSEALRLLLGSAPRPTTSTATSSASGGLAASSVDAVMPDVLSALEVRLSDDLQNTLTSDDPAGPFAADDALGELGNDAS
ncbi:MAG: tandem-95 repeat protein, partial [Planctomycetota bacterium]